MSTEQQRNNLMAFLGNSTLRTVFRAVVDGKGQTGRPIASLHDVAGMSEENARMHYRITDSTLDDLVALINVGV